MGGKREGVCVHKSQNVAPKKVWVGAERSDAADGKSRCEYEREENKRGRFLFGARLRDYQ